jgi:SpoVK/Ycf46/Vps4 family AAA+-type ATPase
MGASAHVLALVRSHYSGDERAFVESALSLARGTKSTVVKNAITDAIRNRPKTPPAFRPLDARQAPKPVIVGGMCEVIDARGLDELVLPEELRQQLDEVALEIEFRHALVDRGLRPRNRLLFIGPPGCGKTSAAGAMATRVSLTASAVSLPSLISKWVGETGENLGKLFEAMHDGALVVLDEIDALGAVRGGVDNSAAKSYNSIVNTMLTLLDRKRAGVIVATTNRVDILDPALIRRFDEVLEFPGPTPQQKLDLALRLAKKFEVDAPPRECVLACEHFAAVEKLVETEARRAVMREVLSAEEDE